MSNWLDEGRVAPDAYVWREGWADWRLASEAFDLATDDAQEVVVGSDTTSPEPNAIPQIDIVAEDKVTERIVGPSLNPDRSLSKSLPTVIVLGVMSLVLFIGLIWVVLSNQN